MLPRAAIYKGGRPVSPEIPRTDPADVAARLRQFIARHDAERRRNARVIRILIARNMWLAALVGRLRKLAKQYDHDAALIAQERSHRVRSNDKPEMRRAA
jgi:hypothetical protein